MSEAPAVCWTALRGGNWQNGRCWDAGRPPLPDERACFDRPVAGVVNVDAHVAVARVEVDLGDPRAAVTLGGSGTLVLTGADRFQGKPVALQVADGTLHLAAPLRVEVAAPRFGAHPGGTLIVATPHVRAVAEDLKLMVSQTGALELRTDRWEPGFDLDVATSRTLGLGPHVIDFGAERGPEPRLLAFRSFKEHDGDELLIRGFRPGDQLRFEEDPYESTDPGKELRLHAVRFAGTAHGGAARVERSDRFFYLLPRDRRFTMPSAEPAGTKTSRPVTAARTAAPGTIAETARAGDAISLPDGRLLAAIADGRAPVSISVSAGDGWSRPTALLVPAGSIGATAPSLLPLPSGAILLVYQALYPSGGMAVAAAVCNAPARAGTACAWSRPRAAPGLEPGLQLANGRLAQGNAALMLPFTLGAQAGVLTSTDEGATWRRHGPLLAGPGAGLRYPAVVESEPGHLILLAATSTHRIYRSESPDGGATWSMPTEVTTLVAPDAPFALSPLARGAGLMVAWNHHSHRGDGSDRIRLSVSTSVDGIRWDRPRLLTPDPSQLATCPSLAPIDDERSRFVATYVHLAHPGNGTGMLQSVELTIPSTAITVPR
ncbi:MAG: sialidase family protein [Spirochaetaceae bacterium]|nr:sialidase family protein [Spirochaetaceae bacterium]